MSMQVRVAQLVVAVCVGGCSAGLLLGGGAPSDATTADGAPGTEAGTTPSLDSTLPPGADGPGVPPKKDIGGPKPDKPPPPPTGWTLGQVPFLPSSSWNTPIPASATYTKLPWPASAKLDVNWENYTPGIYISLPSDPLVQVSIPEGWGYPAGKIAVRLASGVSGAAGQDGEILIVDGTTVHNFWQLTRTGTNSGTASSYGKTDVLKGTGWGSKSPFLSAGITASGSSMLAGLLVQAESDKGDVNHALQLALDYELQKPGYTGEAIAGDGSNANGVSKEGERLAIPPSAQMPGGLSPLGQKVFRALQKYGCFNIDISGGISILRVQANAYNASTINTLRGEITGWAKLLQRVN
jgi:hypothetical protein